LPETLFSKLLNTSLEDIVVTHLTAVLAGYHSSRDAAVIGTSEN